MAFLLIGLFLTLVSLIVYKAFNRKAPAEFPTELPAFELITIDGLLFTSDSVRSGKMGLVFYSPGCLFCEHEVKELAKHAVSFEGSQFLFITTAPLDSAVAFTLRNGIDAAPHFYSLVDTTFMTPLLFGLRTIPTTLIYNEDKILFKGFEGEVNAAKLFKTMHQYDAAKEKAGLE